MNPGLCICQSDDCVSAKEAIRRAWRTTATDELADESHFMASIGRCSRPGCGQQFLTMFCEQVDWVDSDDPQSWLAVPISEGEARQLRAADIAADENAMLRIITGERRFLYHTMPKGAPETLTWRTGPLFIPPHD